MSTPADHLPGLTADADIDALLLSIGLPAATSIRRAAVTAQYHAIYFLTLPPSAQSRGHGELVLRVSGRHLPGIKTRNEVGVMAWLAQSTAVPIAEVIASDATEANPIGHEYTLLSRVAGVPLSDVYDALDEDGLAGVVDQLIDVLCELHAHTWDGIGGRDASPNTAGKAALARIVDENFWQAADVEALWPAGETVDTLNVAGPYASYVDFVAGQIRMHMRLIRVHDALACMRDDDTLARLEALVTVALPKHAAELNRVALRLAHKDLLMANIIVATNGGGSARITAVLDWEFAGVVPFPKWNPARSFLWNGRNDDKSPAEKQRLVVPVWKATLLENLAKLGV